MDRIRKLLSTNVKRRRKALGYSQMKLAELAELSTSYIAEIEGGKKFPSSTAVERIADALDLEPSELFAEIEKRKGRRDAAEVVASFAEDVVKEIANAVERTKQKYLKRP